MPTHRAELMLGEMFPLEVSLTSSLRRSWRNFRRVRAAGADSTEALQRQRRWMVAFDGFTDGGSGVSCIGGPQYWRIAMLGAVAATVVFITVATSHGDATPSLPTVAPSEPITGQPVTPDPATAATELPHDPFTPYSAGPAPGDTSPKPTWAYEDLTPQQKAVVNRGRDVAGQQASLDAFAAAAAERAHFAAGQAAQNQLGLDDVSGTGVVP